MGKDSDIQWCHHTFNPWWGCVRVSPGCEHCYAEAFDKRVGRADWGVKAPRRFFGEKHWAEPLKWDRAAAAAGDRHRVFCASMSDVFEARLDLAKERLRLWDLIHATTNLDWLLLTKRPENLMLMLPWGQGGEPWPNVWVGTTVEDERRAQERIPILRAVPAVVRFLSMEPLLELPTSLDLTGIHWVIAGGESGHRARHFDLAWARSLRDRCKAAGAAFFFKQAGTNPVELSQVSELNGAVGLMQLSLKDGHGGDMEEWPEELRVREFPR
jgi:protein gp37